MQKYWFMVTAKNDLKMIVTAVSNHCSLLM